MHAHTHMHTHACSSIFVRTSVYMMHFLILIRSEKASQIALTLLRRGCAGHHVTCKQYVYSSVSTGTWMQNNRKQQEAEALFVHHRCPRRYVGHVCGLCFQACQNATHLKSVSSFSPTQSFGSTTTIRGKDSVFVF